MRSAQGSGTTAVKHCFEVPRAPSRGSHAIVVVNHAWLALAKKDGIIHFSSKPVGTTFPPQ